jgi:hypothetical protein
MTATRGLGARGRDAADVVEDAIQRRCAERDDFGAGAERRGECPDVALTDGAHLAHDLRDHHVGREITDAFRAHVIQRATGIDEVANRDVDLARRGFRVDRTGRHDVTGADDRREIALVRYADDRIDVTEGSHDLGGGREEGDDAHA